MPDIDARGFRDPENTVAEWLSEQRSFLVAPIGALLRRLSSSGSFVAQLLALQNAKPRKTLPV
jgi:hypothetical protein